MPHRNQLLDLLDNYKPSDTAEIAYKAKMIEFAKLHPDCFERSLGVGHFTGSAWLLNKDGTKALLALITASAPLWKRSKPALVSSAV